MAAFDFSRLLKPECFPTNSRLSDTVDKPRVQAISASAEGDLYFGRGSLVCKMGPDGVEEVYAGQFTGGAVDGHRLDEATFISVRCVRVLNPYKGARQPTIMIAEDSGNCIRRIEGDMVTRYAGTGQSGQKDGPRLEATFAFPVDIIKAHDGRFYISDYNHCHIRVIELDGMVTTIGNGTDKCIDGSLKTASFDYPRGLCLSTRGTVFVAEHMSHNIREVHPDGKVTTALRPDSEVLPRSPAAGASEASVRGPFPSKSKTLGPLGIAAIPGTQDVIIVDNLNGSLRMWNLEDGSLEVLNVTTTNPAYVAFTPNGDMWWTEYKAKGQMDLFCIRGATHPFEPIYERRTVKPFEKNFLLFIDDAYSPENIQLRQSGGLQNSVITFQHSGETLKLLRPVIQLTATRLLEPEIMARVEAAKMSLATMKLWIETLHGVNVDPSSALRSQRAEAALQCAQFACLSSLAEYTCGKDWYLDLFQKTLRLIQDAPALTTLLLSVSDSCSELPDILEAVVTRLEWVKRNKELETRKQNPKDNADQEAEEEVDATVAPQYQAPRNLESPQKHLIKALRRLWQTIQDNPEKELPEELPGANFSIYCENSSSAFKVHDWILYARWPFFKRMIDSGMSESNSRQLELPEDFPLKEFLTYLYRGSIYDLSFASAWYFRRNAGEFALENLDGEVVADFRRLLDSCEELVWPIPSSRNATDILLSYLEHCPSPSPQDPELQPTLHVLARLLSKHLRLPTVPDDYLTAISGLMPKN